MIAPAALSMLPLLISPEQEHWQQQPARPGDHLRVSRGAYTHHGIYVSHSEVIHFSSLEDDNLMGDGNEVIATSLSRFLLDGNFEVKIYTDDEHKDLYPVADIVRWARNSLGDSGYHLVFNNCEHFANWCTLGRFHSHQVNNLLGGMSMGWGILGTIASGVVDFFSGGSSSSGGGGGSRSTESTTNNYNYDPDKVRVAEIEAESKRDMAYQENQRIGLMKDAQIELAKINALMEVAVIEAKVRGFDASQKILLEMTRTLTQIAQERLVLLEQGHLGAVAQIDSHYRQLEQQIGRENDEYMQEKLPKLNALLAQYPEGSTNHKIYNKAMDMDMARHFQFQTTQIQGVQQRRNMMTESAIESRKLLEQHVNTLVETRMQHLQITLDNSSQLSPAQLQVYRQQLLGEANQAQSQIVQKINNLRK